MAPIKLMERFTQLYGKHVKSTQKAPILSSSTAVALSIVFTLIYIVPFYLSSATRPSPQLSRDAPSSIRARVRAVTFSSLASLALTIYVLYQSAGVKPNEILKLLGLWPFSLLDTARTLLLVNILFAGPLFEAGIVDGGWKDWVRGRYVQEVLSSWIGYRNFVVGPVSEELIWRSLIIPLHILAHFSGKKIIFLTPLYFGIAHVHHFYEFRLTHPHSPVLQGILRSAFQFTYTSLFGFFAAFVYLRTGNLLSIILAHSFCNWMGLPRFWGRVGVEAGVPIGPPDLDKKRNEDSSYRSGELIYHSKPIAWTVVYYAILVAGAVGFYYQLFPLTESSYSLPVVLGDA
ncbi:Abi-domain-containing protein [Delitschia confertaspora ATCC 74209]|uniref:intramembrane prenyl-peptidase Rce1 n=1 Tax=Delitschia confertaspora ATCC 74209 TaxID=1513339 RepID=A0A9P4MRR2_9PLEO|nr:Abi-domain-containing protein [Delitschia confertaspora ATCC 74209]